VTCLPALASTLRLLDPPRAWQDGAVGHKTHQASAWQRVACGLGVLHALQVAPDGGAIQSGVQQRRLDGPGWGCMRVSE
jgi:hypothetical protein